MSRNTHWLSYSFKTLSYGEINKKNVTLYTVIPISLHHLACCVQDMFGEESVPKIFQGDRIYVSVDNKRANINLSELKVTIFLSSFYSLFYSSIVNFPASPALNMPITFVLKRVCCLNFK